MRTIRLSTNWILILKLFLPVAWLSFFMVFFFGVFLVNPVEVPQFTTSGFRMGLMAFIVLGLVFLRFTFYRLKRVDADNDFVYVSTYFKTYRYTYDSIEAYVLYDHFLFKAVHILLKEKGSLGKRMIFLPKMIHFKEFVEAKSLQGKLKDAGDRSK